MQRCRLGLLVPLALGFLVGPLAAQAQRIGKLYRIGWLSASLAPPEPSVQMQAFQQGLRDLGYVEGQNFVMEGRAAEGSVERLPDLAAELVRLQIEVLVAGGAPAIRVAHHTTRTIPIVMAGTSDAVELGFVASLARRGGTSRARAGWVRNPLASGWSSSRSSCPRARGLPCWRIRPTPTMGRGCTT
jgi:putative tryptophan/tyrosine transport system substrate-binding protein